MNSKVRKISLILCVIWLVSLCYAVTAKEEKTVYEKFNYQENFEYSDEMIGHVLKATVPKIIMKFEANLSYKPVQFDKNKLSRDFEELCKEYEGEYTETEIADFLLDYMSENISDYLTKSGRRKNEKVEGAATGSGVVISEDGYVATNAHVAVPSEQLYSSYIIENITEDLADIIEDIESYGVVVTGTMIAELQDILLSAILEDVEITDEDTYIEVCFPTADGDTAYENSISYQGVVEKKGTQEGKDGLTKDVAILKLVGAKKLVALPLSESYPESNSQIVSAGYPGAAEEIFNAYGSEDSELSVSINTGKATRVVKINDTKYQAIEISSTISNGSSGGPSVDKNLNIEGLNTYMLAADNRFAYMVPAEFIKDLAGDIDLSLSGTSKTFYTGLQMLQQGYGKSAKECFEFTKQLQSKTPYIKHMLSLAEEAPQKEFVSPSQAQTSLWDKIMENKLPIIIISAIFFVFVLLIVIIVFMAKRMRKRKKIIQELGGFSDTEYNEDDYDNEEVVSNVNSPENNRADYGAGNMGYGAERSGSDNGGGARAEGTSRIITTIDTAKREDTSVENAEGQAFFNVPPEL